MADESEADQPSAVKMEEVGKGVGVGERERGLEVDSEVQGTEPGQPSSHLAHVHTLPTAGAGGTTVPESIITATASGSGSGSRSSRRKKMAWWVRKGTGRDGTETRHTETDFFPPPFPVYVTSLSLGAA